MSMLVRRDPFRELNSIRRVMDDVFNRSMSRFIDEGTEDNGALSSWTPTMDIIERNDEIRLRAELPGLTEEDVDITVENNVLTIQGEKKFEESEEEGAYRRIESAYGTFYRRFTLPATVEQDRIDASFSNGVLTVTLPKAEQAKPKKIAVKAS